MPSKLPGLIAAVVVLCANFCHAQSCYGEDLVKAQERKNAIQFADKVEAKILQRHPDGAACLIRDELGAANSWPRSSSSCFAVELNKQLEQRNLLGDLGLQHHNFSGTKQQVAAERALWGSTNLPVSILSSVRTEAIKQGRRGDCWFLSALALVANDYPVSIPSMIAVHSDGSYTVQFPAGGPTINLTAADVNHARKIGARSTQYGDWPLVIECAAAQIYPDEMKNGGLIEEGVKLVAGIKTGTFSLLANKGRPCLIGRDLSETLMAAYEAHEPILLSTGAKSYMVETHAYTVVQVTRASPARLARVTVRNPWGRIGFARRNVFEIEPLRDGKFSVPISSLFKYFGDVVVPTSALRVIPPTASRTTPRWHRLQPATRRAISTAYDRSSPGKRPPTIPLVAYAMCFMCVLLSNRPGRRLLRRALMLCLALWCARRRGET